MIWDHAAGSLRIVANRDLEAGDEILVQYWPTTLGDSETLLLYGFLEKDNANCTQGRSLSAQVADADLIQAQENLVPPYELPAICLARKGFPASERELAASESSTLQSLIDKVGALPISPSRDAAITIPELAKAVCSELSIRLESNQLPHLLLLRERLLALRWNEV